MHEKRGDDGADRRAAHEKALLDAEDARQDTAVDRTLQQRATADVNERLADPGQGKKAARRSAGAWRGDSDEWDAGDQHAGGHGRGEPAAADEDDRRGRSDEPTYTQRRGEEAGTGRPKSRTSIPSTTVRMSSRPNDDELRAHDDREQQCTWLVSQRAEARERRFQVPSGSSSRSKVRRAGATR